MKMLFVFLDYMGYSARVWFIVLLACGFSVGSVCGCAECSCRSESLLRGDRRSVATTSDQLNKFTILPIEVTFADASNCLPDNGSD
jgi:hypothetical protein